MKKILLRRHKTCKAELGIGWYQRIIVFMFWRTYPHFLEIRGCRGNMIGVLESALNYLPTRKGGKEGANRSYNFQSLFSAPPSYQHPNPSPSKTQCHIENSSLPKTFSNMSHTRCWLLAGATYRHYIFSDQSLDIFTASQNLHLCASLNQQQKHQPRLRVLHDPCKSAVAFRLQGPPNLTSCSKQ